jgi:hypothetical protein
MRGNLTAKLIAVGILASFLCALVGCSPRASAQINQLPIPQPGSGAYGLEATKTQPAPTQGATITTPSGGAFSTSPITVAGICPPDLLVEIFNNNVMVGSVDCKNGSFTLQVSLFPGTNELSAMVYDDLDQAGPISNIVTVTYNNANFSAFGTLVTLSSSYGRRGANPGTVLTWPLQLSGGTGPYAFSIDWGDGTPLELKSQAASGLVTLNHTYSKAGIYHVSIKVADANGVTAFLQVVAVSNGNVQATKPASDSKSSGTVVKVLWLPALIMFILLLPAFWLGRRSMAEAMKRRH